MHVCFFLSFLPSILPPFLLSSLSSFLNFTNN
jgi:hypothetical protein